MRQFQFHALVAAVVVVPLTIAGVADATEPCGDFGECKVLVEVNASDGDIGFHFLMDGAELVTAGLIDPNGTPIFRDGSNGPLAEQTMTEMFVESAEPLCWPDPDADPEDEIVTLPQFLDRWTAGTYLARGLDADSELAAGETVLTFDLPAAPSAVDFDGSVVSWAAGDDLGNCASFDELTDLVNAGMLPAHPVDVPVSSWEIVFEPDVEPDSPANGLKYSIRVAGDVATTAVTVPADYLASLPDDTPVKVEVGAIGMDDNATFSEEDGFCVNEVVGCPE